MGAAGGVDVFEGDGVADVVGIDCFAQETAVVEDPDFGDVAGVVADGDGFSHVGGQEWVEVSQSLEVDAVAVHDAWFRDVDEQ